VEKPVLLSINERKIGNLCRLEFYLNHTALIHLQICILLIFYENLEFLKLFVVYLMTIDGFSGFEGERILLLMFWLVNSCCYF
jgi:hypothetical protein